MALNKTQTVYVKARSMGYTHDAAAELATFAVVTGLAARQRFYEWANEWDQNLYREHVYLNDDEARTARRHLINIGYEVSLLAGDYRGGKDVTVFDVVSAA